MNKRLQRLKRATKTRSKIKRQGYENGTLRFSIHRSANHIYAQILAPLNGKVLACASSLEAAIRAQQPLEGGKVATAKVVGQLIAERAKAAGVEQVACDRSGFKYHGRVAALVSSARENGLVV
jgi:large subunit ribosomal protein L18